MSGILYRIVGGVAFKSSHILLLRGNPLLNSSKLYPAHYHTLHLVSEQIQVGVLELYHFSIPPKYLLILQEPPQDNQAQTPPKSHKKNHPHTNRATGQKSDTATPCGLARPCHQRLVPEIQHGHPVPQSTPVPGLSQLTTTPCLSCTTVPPPEDNDELRTSSYDETRECHSRHTKKCETN